MERSKSSAWLIPVQLSVIACDILLILMLVALTKYAHYRATFNPVVTVLSVPVARVEPITFFDFVSRTIRQQPIHPFATTVRHTDARLRSGLRILGTTLILPFQPLLVLPPVGRIFYLTRLAKIQKIW
jgi:hypothetical protein